MKTSIQTTFVPVLSSPAGSCLTTANWKALGITHASCELLALLMKPGLELLSQVSDLATYINWPDTLVLNASSLCSGVDGCYKLRSQYDGRVMIHSVEQIVTLITSLKPSILILPQGSWKKDQHLWETLPDNTLVMIPHADLLGLGVPKANYGVYYAFKEMDTFMDEWASNKERMSYIAGDLNLPVIRILKALGVHFIESNRPANDACLGNMYSREGDLLLLDNEHALVFDVLDKECKCPTCSQHLSRAYLHHLLANTPLLCQRMLVQHNVAMTLV